MTTYSWPTGIPNPARVRPRYVSNVRAFRSPISGAITTASRGGQWRERVLEWQNLSGANRAIVLAMLHRLNSMEHRQAMPEFLHVQRGAYGGTPVVDGGSQTGGSIAIRGASVSVTNWARAGDLVQFDANPRVVVADASSDGTGDVVLEIRPKIRTAPADATALVVSAASLSGVWILADFSDYSDDDILASGELASSIAARFIEDTLA